METVALTEIGKLIVRNARVPVASRSYEGVHAAKKVTTSRSSWIAQPSVDVVDLASNDSFPASDPPSWIYHPYDSKNDAIEELS